MFGGAYRNRRVLVTGHTGFKGSWLALWLVRLGARVSGFALPPPTDPSLFVQAGIAEGIDHRLGDVRDPDALRAAISAVRPEFVFHLAAQPLVLGAYDAPVETFAINVMGSINLMEAIRAEGLGAAVVMVTTDKVYRNREWPHGYREVDPLGGHDPYSASKAAMEIAVASWRDSYFAPARIAEHGVAIAQARAGNVIGGGDWAANRIIPDLVRARAAGVAPGLRHPGAERPWQHVLEPLAGYLELGARLAGPDAAFFAEAWNFGPLPTEVRTVGALAAAFGEALGGPVQPAEPGGHGQRHEAGLLRLSIDKAVASLAWRPVWGFAQTVERTAGWYRRVADDRTAARAATEADISAYCREAGAGTAA